MQIPQVDLSKKQRGNSCHVVQNCDKSKDHFQISIFNYLNLRPSSHIFMFKVIFEKKYGVGGLGKKKIGYLAFCMHNIYYVALS